MEAGREPVVELTGFDLLGEEAEHQLSDEKTTEVEVAAEWQDKATEEEYVLGTQCDLPIDKKRVQRASLQHKN
jgi:hypothetical protein